MATEGEADAETTDTYEQFADHVRAYHYVGDAAGVLRRTKR